MRRLIMEKYRRFLKEHDWEKTPDLETDQQKKVPPPPLQKAPPEGAVLIDLIPPERFTVGGIALIEAIKRRKSHRGFLKDPLSVEELSFLLWATQGIHKVHIDHRHGAKTTKRTVPSGGSRHPFETYLVINRVNGLQPGIYRYLAIEHKLCFLSKIDSDLPEKIAEMCYDQKFVGLGAVVFIWTTIPSRTEWRYSIAAHKGIAIDAGHLCQNLYLACEAIKAGTCAIAAYNQKKIDKFLGVDGKDEFVMYLAPVGKLR